MNNKIKTTLAERLKESRKKAKLSQAEVASALGITQASLSDLERGKSKSTLHTLKFAEIYSINPLWLSTGEGTRSPSLNEDFNQLNKKNQVIVSNLIAGLIAGQEEDGK